MERVQAAVEAVARKHGLVPTKEQRRLAQEWYRALIGGGYPKWEAEMEAAERALRITHPSPYSTSSTQ